ncbi:MAG: urease accessory protein UreD [Nitrososphaerota archaeon]
MAELNFCTPDDIPSEFLVYDEKINTLRVGTPGKTGILRVLLEKDQIKNKTVLTDQYSKVPLYTQRVLHYDTANPDMAYLFIMSPSGGLLQGDRHRMDITLKNEAVANLVTQGATRIYKMDSNYATQIININVDADCYLEFIPDQIIPYKNSRYYQKVNITADDSATVVYSEVVTPGRVAMGELFDYDICYLKTVGKDHNNKIKFIDTSLLNPKEQTFSHIGILDKYTIFGTVYILAKKDHLHEIQEKINNIFENSEVFGGCSILPDNSGLVVRILGNYFDDIKTTIYETIRIVRKQILNSSFDGIRKT